MGSNFNPRIKHLNIKQLHTHWHDVFPDSSQEFPIFGWYIIPDDDHHKNVKKNREFHEFYAQNLALKKNLTITQL